MIAANELRIGNWVDTPNGKILLTMISDEHHKAGTFGEWEVSLSNLLPIPITPEILEKCGFWAHMDGGYYLPEDPNDKDNLLPKHGFIFNEEMDYHYEDHYAHRSIKIESVHQLQNLYFALTNQELNVQL